MNKLHRNFPLEKVFEFKAIKQAKSQKDIPTDDKGVPYVVQSTVNNMVARFVDEQYLIDNGEAPVNGNAIVLGVTLPAVSYQKNKFGASQVITARSKNLDEKTGLYLVGVLSKYMEQFSYQKKPGMAIYKAMEVSFPVIENPNPDYEYTVDDIDWQYMRDRITELERDRITELDAYLQATGLDDYELTNEDKRILSLSTKTASDEKRCLEDISEDEVRFGEFELGGDKGLFDIYSPSKRFNANTIQFGGKYPYVARGSSNNGIRGYITEDEKYLSPAKSLSFGQDTATVFYQPNAYFTGDKIKVMVLKNHVLTPELAEYFIAVISRAFSTFAWGQNSFNENIIKQKKITLPVTSYGKPDFDYMERYIRAMEKVVIADVVKYKDQVIGVYKKKFSAY